MAGFCVENVLGQLTASETAVQGSVSGDVIGADQAASRAWADIADMSMVFSYSSFPYLNFFIFVLGRDEMPVCL